VRLYRISRPTNDANYVIVDLEFDSAGEAESFRTALRELWGRIGGELGLQDPQARIVEAVESKQ
jgi:hypothetical protein